MFHLCALASMLVLLIVLVDVEEAQVDRSTSTRSAYAYDSAVYLSPLTRSIMSSLRSGTSRCACIWGIPLRLCFAIHRNAHAYAHGELG